MKLQLVATAIAALVAWGCVTSASERETKPSMEASVQLSGTKWEVTSIRGANVKPGMRNTMPMLAFVDEERVSFTGGCNQFTGTYTYASPENIQFGGTPPGAFAGTRMACPKELMEQDHALVDALQHTAKILTRDDEKVLVDHQGVELVRLKSAPPM
jgi:heat shock protein HslJ